MSTFLGAQSGAEDSGQSHMNLQEMMALIKDEYKHCIGGAGNKCKLDEGNEQIYYLESSGKRHWVEGGACTICGGKGHLTKVCCFKGKSKCGNCERFGHATDDCFSPGGLKYDEHKKQRKEERDQKKKQKKGDSTQAHIAHTKSFDMVFVATDADVQMGDNATHVSLYSWITDTSATTMHITNNWDARTDFINLNKEIIKIGASSISAIGQGFLKLRTQVNNKMFVITLTNVLYASTMRNNLLSIGKLDEAGSQTITGGGKIQLLNWDGQIFAKGRKLHMMYYLSVETMLPKISNTYGPYHWELANLA